MAGMALGYLKIEVQEFSLVVTALSSRPRTAVSQHLVLTLFTKRFQINMTLETYTQCYSEF